MNRIMLAVGSSPNIRIWPRVVGVGRAIGNPDQVIKFGMKGESDIDGIIAPYGRKLSIEVKTGSAVLNKDQEKYRAMIEKFGGLYIEARSLKEVLAKLEKYM